MEPFYLNFIIAALFMIVSALFYVCKNDKVGMAWAVIAAFFILNAGYYSLIDSLNICSG